MNLSKPGMARGDGQVNELLNSSNASVQSGKTPRFILSKEPSKMDSMRLKPVLSLNASPNASPNGKPRLKPPQDLPSANGSRRILDFGGEPSNNSNLLAVPSPQTWKQEEVAEEGSVKSSPKTNSALGPRIEGIKAPRASSPHQDFTPPDTPTSRSNFIYPQAVAVHTEHSFFERKDTDQHQQGALTNGVDPMIPKLDLKQATQDRHNYIIYGDGSDGTDRSKLPLFSNRNPEKTGSTGLDLKNLLEHDPRGVVSPGFKFDQTSKMLVSSNIIDMQPDVNLFLKTQRTLESLTKRELEPPVSYKGNTSISQIRSSQIRGSARKLEDSRISNYRNGLFSSRVSHDGGQTTSRKLVYGKKNSNLIEPEAWAVKPVLFNWRMHNNQPNLLQEKRVNNNRTIQEQESELYDEYKIPLESPILLTEVLNRPNTVRSQRDQSLSSNETAKINRKQTQLSRTCPKLTPMAQNFPVQELFLPPTVAPITRSKRKDGLSQTPGPKCSSTDNLQPSRSRPQAHANNAPTVSWLSIMRGEFRPKTFFELGEREQQDVVVAERALVAQIAAACVELMPAPENRDFVR